MVNDYIPAKNDIIYINLHPRLGNELAKRRPCLVLSGKELNHRLGRVVICPISSVSPKIGTHIPLPKNQKASGTIIVDQIKSLDWRARKAEKVDFLGSQEIFEMVIERLNTTFEE